MGVFVQDDYPWRGFEGCFSKNLTYYDLSTHIAERPYQTRGTSFWSNRRWGAAVEQCWRDFADIFHLPGFEHKKEPKVRFHPGNYFALTDKVLAPWVKHGVMPKDEYGWTKHTTGGALEHLRDMIYGLYPMSGKTQKQNPCDVFIPRSQCPGSLCMS